MIRHIFKMVWNRKRTNFLITVEIFFSFLVLFAVVLFAVYYLDNYRRPLGFNYENVWNISPGPQTTTAGNSYSIARQLIAAIKEFDEVEAVSGAQAVPYSFSSSNSLMAINGRRFLYEWSNVTDDFKDVLGLDIVRGRWFTREDDGMNWLPVVINSKMSEEAFGSEDPLGKNIAPEDEPRQWRVVGVVSDFRKEGEFSAPYNFLFHRLNLDNAQNSVPENIVIKVRPGTTADFEEKLVKRMQAVARGWTFDIDPLSEMRENVRTMRLAPVFAAGLVAGFLMIMVALGLTGVLWQNVTQRTKEIGLRRAKGATARRIHNQILGELMMIASFGLVVGMIVVAQFPLLDLIGFISGKVYACSIIISLLLVYLLTFLCGLYPSRLATKVHPAEALHYE